MSQKPDDAGILVNIYYPRVTSYAIREWFLLLVWASLGKADHKIAAGPKVWDADGSDAAEPAPVTSSEATSPKKVVSAAPEKSQSTATKATPAKDAADNPKQLAASSAEGIFQVCTSGKTGLTPYIFLQNLLPLPIKQQITELLSILQVQHHQVGYLHFSQAHLTDPMTEYTIAADTSLAHKVVAGWTCVLVALLSIIW